MEPDYVYRVQQRWIDQLPPLINNKWDVKKRGEIRLGEWFDVASVHGRPKIYRNLATARGQVTAHRNSQNRWQNSYSVPETKKRGYREFRIITSPTGEWTEIE